MGMALKRRYLKHGSTVSVWLTLDLLLERNSSGLCSHSIRVKNALLSMRLLEQLCGPQIFIGKKYRCKSKYVNRPGSAKMYEFVLGVSVSVVYEHLATAPYH
jgi:hypothetical protein